MCVQNANSILQMLLIFAIFAEVFVFLYFILYKYTALFLSIFEDLEKACN